jgi:selenide,water dikinase
MTETCDIWSLAKSGGCAAKLSPIVLREITALIHPKRNANLLVGIETSDDAAIYQLTDDLALVLTVDFVTPIYSDPYLYGQVAAANSISDVYAMGGRPIAVMNICCFPGSGVDTATLGKILEGGLSKTEEAGAVLVGGHTVKDDEMKYGLSVTGLVNPKKYTPNSGARAGDKLILTKPVGSGVCISGTKRGLLAPEKLRKVVETMTILNKVACETMMEFEVTGCTDITGFGLGGHAYGMAKASKVSMRIFADRIPTFPEARGLFEQGLATSVTPTNAQNLEGKMTFAANLSPADRQLFYDPQTSGGLFIPIRAKDADTLLRKLHERGVRDAAIVGECVASEPPNLEVVKS